TLLKGHFIITFEGSLLGDCDVEKTVGGHIHMRLEAKSSERDSGSGNDISITGYELMIQGCAVSCEAILQHMTILLTIEVVYMALTEAVKETIWLKGLWKEIGAKLMLVVVVATGALKKVVPSPRFQNTMKLLCVHIKKISIKIIMAAAVDVGPWGGAGGTPFRFPFPGRLIEIIVVSNKDSVYSIQFVCLDNNNNKQYSPKYGGDGPVDATTNIIIISSARRLINKGLSQIYAHELSLNLHTKDLLCFPEFLFKSKN
nr:subtilisin-like protease SBT1.8 [Tanacetum cinerariifolium]